MAEMQVVIPLTGYGSRFKNAGYQRLKPFIEIHGRPMIEWVVSMFQEDEARILFITREEHLQELPYVGDTLTRIAPKAKIFAIQNWQKKGPVYDVLRAASLIEADQPILVSYCDYYMHFDYAQFKKDLAARGCAGSVPCYSGFHPNLIPEKNIYASCRVDQQENLLEIREKFSWEKNKAKTLHSPGLYYFKSGEICKKYSQALVQSDENIRGEYYCSLVYNYLVKDGLDVWCPVNVQHFCQWGTPEDLQDYEFWVNTVRQWEAQ